MRYEHEHMVWETRGEEAYLLVRSNAKSEVGIKQLKSELDDEYVINYDWKRVQEVFSSARGRLEFIGPKFSFFDPEKQELVMLNVKALKVSMTLKPPPAQLDVTVEDVAYLLKKKNVIHGVDWAVISQIINKKSYGETSIIAVCTPPEHGKNSVIKEEIEIDPDSKPIILAGGQADFKNIKTVTQVLEGELLAIRYPPIIGRAGIDVWGNAIQPNIGKELPLPKGLNTELSKDKNKLLAQKSGYVYRGKGTINIGELLTIPGNVDYKSGNIKYAGAVIVYGNVISGFRVEAKGDIRVEGTVEACEIVSHEGSVVLEGGVFGKGKAVIRAKKNMKIERIQDALVDCEGTLEIVQSVRNCNVKAENIHISESCQTISNKITAYHVLEVFTLGKEDEKNELFILDKEIEIKKKKQKELEDLERKITGILNQLEKRMKSMQKMMERNEGQPSEREQKELNQVLLQHQLTKKKFDFVSGKRTKIEDEMLQPKELKGRIKIKGDVHKSTYIQVYDARWERNETLRQTELTWSPEGMVFKKGESKSEA